MKKIFARYPLTFIMGFLAVTLVNVVAPRFLHRGILAYLVAAAIAVVAGFALGGGILFVERITRNTDL